jgi:nucleoid-associated protein YgaU
MTRLPGRGTSVTATMTQLARADGPDRRRPSPVLDTPDDARGLDADADAVPETWTVAAGDSFWSIADEVLTDAAGRRPPEHQVRRYWLELIETNRPGLADPANPDLLIPGQQLELPPAHS